MMGKLDRCILSACVRHLRSLGKKEKDVALLFFFFMDRIICLSLGSLSREHGSLGDGEVNGCAVSSLGGVRVRSH